MRLENATNQTDSIAKESMSKEHTGFFVSYLEIIYFVAFRQSFKVKLTKLIHNNRIVHL